MNASPKTPVNWADVVNTQANARARIALDDGSVLNVGSDSSLKVAKSDGAAQQTELDLAYGKLRSQAQKITKTDGSLKCGRRRELRAWSARISFLRMTKPADRRTRVFEGQVKFCNLAGVCVLVKAGQMSSVRSNDNSSPLNPTQATLDELTTAVNATTLAAKPGVVNVVGHGISKPWGITLGIISVGLAVAIPVAVVHNTNNPVAPPKPPVCNPQTSPNGC